MESAWQQAGLLIGTALAAWLGGSKIQQRKGTTTTNTTTTPTARRCAFEGQRDEVRDALMKANATLEGLREDVREGFREQRARGG